MCCVLSFRGKNRAFHRFPLFPPSVLWFSWFSTLCLSILALNCFELKIERILTGNVRVKWLAAMNNNN